MFELVYGLVVENSVALPVGGVASRGGGSRLPGISISSRSETPNSHGRHFFGSWSNSRWISMISFSTAAICSGTLNRLRRSDSHLS